jgi:hypothetical protein
LSIWPLLDGSRAEPSESADRLSQKELVGKFFHTIKDNIVRYQGVITEDLGDGYFLAVQS